MVSIPASCFVRKGTKKREDKETRIKGMMRIERGINKEEIKERDGGRKEETNRRKQYTKSAQRHCRMRE